MQSESDLKRFNDVIANRVVRWWEVQSSEPGFDRDTLYLRVESIPERTVRVGNMDLPDMRPSPQYLRIRADHREHGAALVVEVVPFIPEFPTRNLSGRPVWGERDLVTGEMPD